MMVWKLHRILAAVGLSAAVVAGVAIAGTDDYELSKQDWPHNGPFGTYDKASLQRGFQIYREVCSNCHAMSLLSYRNLTALGYDAAQIKAIAASVQVTDGPNDQGEMYERPGRPSDRFKSPFPNEKASRAANNGAYPKDLSLIVKAREGGEDYVFALLTGYADPPPGFKLQDGLYYNKAFPGHQIAMPPPLTDGAVTFADGSPNDLKSEVRNVAQFLTWASEPNLDQRKQLGAKVMIFLAVFTTVMYAAKKKIWENAPGHATLKTGAPAPELDRTHKVQ